MSLAKDRILFSSRKVLMNNGIMYSTPHRACMCGSENSTHTSIGGHSSRSRVYSVYKEYYCSVPDMASRRANSKDKAAREGSLGKDSAMIASVPWSDAVGCGGGGCC